MPWQIDAYVLAPAPDGKWWEHGPVGPGFQFMLGEQGGFGGGDVGTFLNEGTHLSASTHVFGSQPSIVAWTGVTSERVVAIEVRLGDGEVRRVEPIRLLDGFPPVFWFFPPRGAPGDVVALAADGAVLQTDHLVDSDVPPNANSGSAVNPFGYRDDRPPPGWPPDDTVYGPGEGPRHAEDFHLHEVTFPIYALMPDRWDGYACLSGSSTSMRGVDEVRIGYFEEPAGGRRGLEVVSGRPDRHGRRTRHDQDVGVWWAEPYSDPDVLNFAPRFLSTDELRASFGEFGLPDFGVTRVAALTELEVDGHRVEARRREFARHPALRCVDFVLPGVRVVVQGWGLSFDELEEHARALEPLELGTDLLQALKDAQDRSDRRASELYRHDEP
ncbi:MAG TPA: hypothetical protein VIC58_09520 [Actinomycetota bacterium]